MFADWLLTNKEKSHFWCCWPWLNLYSGGLSSLVSPRKTELIPESWNEGVCYGRIVTVGLEELKTGDDQANHRLIRETIATPRLVTSDWSLGAGAVWWELWPAGWSSCQWCPSPKQMGEEIPWILPFPCLSSSCSCLPLVDPDWKPVDMCTWKM